MTWLNFSSHRLDFSSQALGGACSESYSYSTTAEFSLSHIICFRHEFSSLFLPLIMLCYTNIPTMRIFKLLILLTLVPAGYSFPSGAGACIRGESNLRFGHISNLGQPEGRPIVTGSLAEGGLQVLLGGAPLSPNSLNFFTKGEEYALKVVGDDSYKGILIRLEAGAGVNTTAALIVEEEDSALLYETSVCSEPSQGITHSSSVLKNNIGGTVRVDEITNVGIGVTIVVANNSTTAISYFSQFQLEVTEAPTAAPARPPTFSPTEAPTFAPTNIPTFRPTRAPTEEPSPSPTISSQPSVFCVQAGDTCTANSNCCGANVCIGVCSRFIRRVDKDSDKNIYKLSEGRVRGDSSRRKLLKGSRPRQD
jgi:hypothetical protein